MKHHRFRLILIAAAATLATACGHGGGAGTANAPKATGSSTAPSITIADFKFTPGAIKVRTRASVEVTNTDNAPHTLTADDDHSFDSGTVEPGKSTIIRAPGPGRYAYHCQIHPYMKGSLVVE
jgi:plastocyanin